MTIYSPESAIIVGKQYKITNTGHLAPEFHKYMGKTCVVLSIKIDTIRVRFTDSVETDVRVRHLFKSNSFTLGNRQTPAVGGYGCINSTNRTAGHECGDVFKIMGTEPLPENKGNGYNLLVQFGSEESDGVATIHSAAMFGIQLIHPDQPFLTPPKRKYTKQADKVRPIETPAPVVQTLPTEKEVTATLETLGKQIMAHAELKYYDFNGKKHSTMADAQRENLMILGLASMQNLTSSAL